MLRFITRHWLSVSLTALAGFVLLGLTAVENVPRFVEYEQTVAIRDNMVPTESMACKTAKSCYQRQLQKDFQAKQKAELKAFQAAQKVRMKAKYKPLQTAINHNRDLSANQKKAMLHELAAQQKADVHAENADEKAQLKTERDDYKSILKELVKNCGC